MIGGGVSGLTATYRLSRLLPTAQVQVFEASDRLGGVLCTQREENYLLEFGADSFIDKLPAAVDLCHELGLGEEILPTNESPRRALILHQGKLHPVPTGFVQLRAEAYLPMLKTPILSWSGKLRLLAEGWISQAGGIDDENYDESVAAFATRRYGREVFQRLVQPLLAGIYTADAHQLSTAATMATAIEAERRHGSLRAATLARKQQPGSDSKASGARYASFVTLRSGLQQLIEKLVDQLPGASILTNTPVEKVTSTDGSRWSVSFGSSAETFDAVVIALPAPQAATLLALTDKPLSEHLNSIPYASSAVAVLAYQRDQINDPLDGFGVVVPAVEGRKIVAASFSSVKFPGRAPDDQVLIRVFMGGVLQADLLEQSEEQLRELAHREIADILQISGTPVRAELVRWIEKMPQYQVGHLQLVDQIETLVANHRGLALAGNAYRGVGIPQCIASGETAAQRIANDLQKAE